MRSWVINPHLVRAKRDGFTGREIRHQPRRPVVLARHQRQRGLPDRFRPVRRIELPDGNEVFERLAPRHGVTHVLPHGPHAETVIREPERRGRRPGIIIPPEPHEFHREIFRGREEVSEIRDGKPEIQVPGKRRPGPHKGHRGRVSSALPDRVKSVDTRPEEVLRFSVFREIPA